MSWRRLLSRWGLPTAPRKYLVVTMLVALTLHSAGNSTPRCSKLIEPSRQLVMTTSRRSQVTSSYGCTPAVVKTRLTFRPFPLVGALAARRVRPDKRSSVSVTELSLCCGPCRVGNFGGWGREPPSSYRVVLTFLRRRQRRPGCAPHPAGAPAGPACQAAAGGRAGCGGAAPRRFPSLNVRGGGRG